MNDDHRRGATPACSAPARSRATRCRRRQRRRAAADVAAADVHAAEAARPRRAPRCACCARRKFVQPDEDIFRANTKKFTEATGIEVRVDFVGWEDMRPQTAVTANTGAGPDI